MNTIYDFVTVAAFVILVGYYLFLSDRQSQTLSRFLLSAVVFAVADQVGDFADRSGAPGLHALAIVLILAGVTYAGLSARS